MIPLDQQGACPFTLMMARFHDKMENFENVDTVVNYGLVVLLPLLALSTWLSQWRWEPNSLFCLCFLAFWNVPCMCILKISNQFVSHFAQMHKACIAWFAKDESLLICYEFQASFCTPPIVLFFCFFFFVGLKKSKLSKNGATSTVLVLNFPELVLCFF